MTSQIESDAPLENSISFSEENAWLEDESDLFVISKSDACSIIYSITKDSDLLEYLTRTNNYHVIHEILMNLEDECSYQIIDDLQEDSNLYVD
ncbi:hypothetical protein OAG24_01110 [bacterium]|nr:hypothetical protein [bacterium]